MKKYEVVIFDFDGTLADSFEWFERTINQAAKKYHFREVAPEEMEKLRGWKTHEIMKFLEVSWWKMPWIASYMRGLMSIELTSINLFPGIEELLLEVSKQDISIVILTSNSYQNVAGVLGQNKLSFITHFECGVSMLGKKQKLKKVLRKLKLKPEQALMVGDETRDIEAAKAIGVDVAAVTWGYSDIQALKAESPSYLVSTVEDLRKLL